MPTAAILAGQALSEVLDKERYPPGWRLDVRRTSSPRKRGLKTLATGSPWQDNEPQCHRQRRRKLLWSKTEI